MTPRSDHQPSTVKRAKRVLMLLENGAFSEDGRVRCEATSLAAAGYRVTVIGPAAKGEGWYKQFGPIAGYQFPTPPMANSLLGYFVEYGYAMTMIAILTFWVAIRRGFDVIHAHNPPDFLVVVGGFWRLFGKKFVFDQHDISPDMYMSRFREPGNRIIHKFLLFFEGLSCRWANHTIATNESYKRLQVERWGIPASRVTVVRNGPEAWHLQDFEPEKSIRGSEPFVIGYVGVMGHQDGVDYLLRSLAILQNELHRSDWRCVLMGRGPAMDDLQRLTTELGIEQHLHFLGWVDYEKVPSYIAATDICVVPDPSNGYNDRSTIVKLMEYMAQGRPVAAFDLPEHRVTAGDTALYAAPNDERDLARQILRLMDDASLRLQLGEAAYRRVRDQFTWKHQEANLLAAYRNVFGLEGVPCNVTLGQQDVAAQRSTETTVMESTAPVPEA
jgi:glycosyltransferase involved in cell wall biosynthesis